MTTPPAWHEAHAADAPALLALMQAFYAEEHLAFDPARARTAADTLLSSADRGRIFLVHESPCVAPVGYFVLTFGFSLEFGGRFVLLDEFYLAPAVRGRGWARLALDFAAQWARAQGASALRLELNQANARARALYLKSEFTSDGRDLFTRRL